MYRMLNLWPWRSSQLDILFVMRCDSKIVHFRLVSCRHGKNSFKSRLWSIKTNRLCFTSFSHLFCIVSYNEKHDRKFGALIKRRGQESPSLTCTKTEKESIYREAEPTNPWLTSVWVNNILMTDCSFITQHERKQIIDIFQSKLVCFLPSVTNIQRHNFCFLFRHKLSTYGETSWQSS